MTEQGAYANALAWCRAGRYADAERELRAHVASAPGDVQALQLLGIALASLGRAADSLAVFEQALALRPESVPLMQNRAQALMKMGRLDEARAQAEAILAVDPDFPAALQILGTALAARRDREGAIHAFQRALPRQAAPEMTGPERAQQRREQERVYNEALALHRAGRPDEAIAAYRRALAVGPAFAEAYVNIGNAMLAQGRTDEAYAHYAEAYRVDPGFPEALTNYGSVLRELGRMREALPLLESAVQKKPQLDYAQNNLGIAYFETGRPAEAVECYRRALELRPTFDLARNNLGNALAAVGRRDEAVATFRDLLARAPSDANAHSNLGVVLQDMGDVEGAIACYRRALELRPDFTAAINNLAFLYQEEGRTAEAVEMLRKALAINPSYARAEYNLALAHLYRFEFAEGWRLHRARYRTVPPVAHERWFPFPRFSAADWDGGHRLAVWREQGVGDQLLYSSLLPDLEGRGQAFVLEIDVRLIPAIKRAHPSWEVTGPDASDEPFRTCDRHAAVGDLAKFLRPTLASFSAQPRALLAADAARASEYRRRLVKGNERLVGVSWRSFQPAARIFVERKKSAPLAAFRGLSLRDDVRILDLQYGDTAAEREAFAAAGGRLARLDDLDLFKDLDGVLAAIEACDLVVTTSNVTAHLAGSIGKRTYLVYLSANPPFHYWATDGAGRCHWYPSLTIVTARDMDTWEKALRRIDELLHP